MKKFILLSCFIYYSVNAQEVYKWKDENGKIHFGDRRNAPSTSKKADIKVLTLGNMPSKVEGAKTPTDNTKSTSVSRPPTAMERQGGKPVDPSRVAPRCKGIVDEIAKVKPGTPWFGLAKEFAQTCPGITYECINSKSQPETNRCNWVEKIENNIINTKNFE